MRTVLLVLIAMVGVGGCKKSARKPRPFDGRKTAVACAATRAPGGASPNMPNAECTKDDDCKTGSNGRCLEVGSRARQNKCTYDACFTDADCKTGGPCECRPDGNTCLPGNCRTDADCTATGSCGAVQMSPCAGDARAYYCRTPDDECLEDSDCGNNSRCTYLPELAHWGCRVRPECPVG